jgi:hypothetical protein
MARRFAMGLLLALSLLLATATAASADGWPPIP